MSTLEFKKQTFLSAHFNGESTLPAIGVGLGFSGKTPKTDEDDGLFLYYSPVNCAFPYRDQDMYDRKLEPQEYDIAVLENEHLKATFLPALGGKLWALYDKDAGKELLYTNEVIRPCNLGIRNAWTSGGVEWNFGFLGHHPHTCTLLSTAKTALEDGTPVLRFYYFERIRAIIVQMDFFLPKGEKFLYTRMRLTNPSNKVVPVYWWSNIAVEEKPGDRNIVPADAAFSHIDGAVHKIKTPGFRGFDNTYPRLNPQAIDYFWALDDSKRRYTCQLDTEGYGLCQTSTSLLKGRKLFVWGNSQGGHKWSNFLTADDCDVVYDEIQCGLARTQYEHLPMPPRTVWEWVEAYGPMQANKKKVHGEWAEARTEVEAYFDRMLPQEKLEKILKDTRPMAKSKAEVVISADNGWAALELVRMKNEDSDMMTSHLDFGTTGKAQEVWLKLMSDGTVGTHDPGDVPASYQIAPEWLILLEKAIADKDADNWYAYFLLGTAKYALAEYDTAKSLLEKSVSLTESAWAYYALSIVERKRSGENEIAYMMKAYNLRPDDLSLAKETMRALHNKEMAQDILSIYDNAAEEIRNNNRCKLYRTLALAQLGKLEEAERLLCHDPGYLVVPDIREGEVSITRLWIDIQKKKGLTHKEMGQVPRDLDFRMATDPEE